MNARALALAVLAVSGCTALRKEGGHKELAQQVAERTGLRTFWDQGTPDDAEVQRRRDALLADGLTAREAAELALLGNPKLVALYEELGVSQADMVQAGLLKNPSFGLSFGIPSGAGVFEIEFSVVQEFVDLLVRPLKTKVARAQFAAEVQRVTHAALETVAEARRAVLAVQTAEQQLKVQHELETLARATAELAERQRKAGNITALTRAAELAAWQQARLSLADAELALAANREALNRALGLWGPATGWTLSEPLPVLPVKEPTVEGLEATAVAQRLDLAAARREAELFGDAVALARTTRFIGRVEVGGHLHQFPGGGPRVSGPELTLDLPIFDQRQALIARLEAQQRQAEHHADGLAVEIRSHVREATTRLLALRRRAEHYRDVLLPLRAEVTEQTQLAYNAMQVGPATLFSARREEGEATAGYLEALRSAHLAQVDLELEVGGRLEAAVAPVPPQQHREGAAP